MQHQAPSLVWIGSRPSGMFDFGAKRIFLWTSTQAPNRRSDFTELAWYGEKDLPRISPCGAVADMPLKWISDAARKKEKSRRVLTLTAPSSPWREEPSGVPPLPCLRPYHAKISPSRTNVCDLANTAWISQLGTWGSPTLEISKGLVMPGAICALNTSTVIGCGNKTSSSRERPTSILFSI
jgi:hypothetical protein